MTRPRVLLADDDDGVRFTLTEILSEAEVDVTAVADGSLALQQLQLEEIDLLITDLRMPQLDGMSLLAQAHQRWPELKVVVITAHGSEATAVQAMKQGAFDYFAKPFDVDQVLEVVRRATENVRLARENHALRATLMLSRHMVFRSQAMLKVAQRVERAAARDVTVLVQGESGTGKELVASALVASSPRASQAFVRFNCAALPRDLAEAELFGHKAGAFTGAVQARPGLFKEAHGGTLFLDEIGELDPVVQGKLLRVLQSGEFRPLGADQNQKVDVRLIAATHKDLREEVRGGRFREDLYFRLDVVRIHLPPLRERPEDLEPLIDHFLEKYGQRFGIPRPRLTPRARHKLLSSSYPGNVRELENTVERWVALATSSEIDDLEADDHPPAPLGLKERVEAYERGIIWSELERNAGNRSETARQLGIGRVTLLDKLKKYGLEPES